MSTSELYHAFNVRGVEYLATQYVGNLVIFQAEMSEKSVHCKDCGNRDVIFKGKKTRRFHMPPIGRKRSILECTIHRVLCKKCGRMWWPQLPFMLGTKRYTRAFALTVLDLLQFATIKAVAKYLRVGWDMIKDIHKTRLQQQYRRPQLKNLVHLGIDEFSIRKGNSYMTIFVDLSTGRIIHAVEGNSSEAITPFLRKISKKAKNLRAVAIDMSTSYHKALKKELQHVDIVFDRYHISALANRALDKLRRELQRQLEPNARKSLKGSRFLLLYNYCNLKDEKKGKLKNLLDLNGPLFTLYIMKELLRYFWQFSSEKAAKKYLEMWCADAMASGIKQLATLGATLHRYKDEMLNFYKHRITNAPVEGINNKIKTLKRQAYGYRDMQYFKLRLYHLHNQGYSLSG